MQRYNFTIPYDLKSSEKQNTNKKNIKSMKTVNRPRSRNSISPDTSSQNLENNSKQGDNIELKKHISQSLFSKILIY